MHGFSDINLDWDPCPPPSREAQAESAAECHCSQEARGLESTANCRCLLIHLTPSNIISSAAFPHKPFPGGFVRSSFYKQTDKQTPLPVDQLPEPPHRPRKDELR